VLELPYVDPSQTPVDVEVWSAIAESRLTGALNASAAKSARKHGVPLRHRVVMRVDPQPDELVKAYAEVHVHPFGVVAISTVDVSWEVPRPVFDLWSTVSGIEGRSVELDLGGTTSASTIGGAAGVAADWVLGRLSPAVGGATTMPDYRIATVIEGPIAPDPLTMPSPASPLHDGLHRLARGSDPLAAPGNAFVPGWSGADFQYSPRRLHYMLDGGAAQCGSSVALADGSPSMSQQHRRLSLLLAHIIGSIGLIEAAPAAGSASITAWSKSAADRMARLYGPTKPDVGLEPRRFLDQPAFRALVEQVRGTPLVAAYPLPTYPA
jgi:hypothetical protein